MVGLIVAFIFIIVIEIIDMIHKINEDKRNEKLQEELEEKIGVILEEYKLNCIKDFEEILSKCDEIVKNIEKCK